MTPDFALASPSIHFQSPVLPELKATALSNPLIDIYLLHSFCNLGGVGSSTFPSTEDLQDGGLLRLLSEKFHPLASFAGNCFP